MLDFVLFAIDGSCIAFCNAGITGGTDCIETGCEIVWAIGSSRNSITKVCSHLGHFARLPSFVRATLNEEEQFGHATGAFMFAFQRQNDTVNRAAANRH